MAACTPKACKPCLIRDHRDTKEISGCAIGNAHTQGRCVHIGKLGDCLGHRPQSCSLPAPITRHAERVGWWVAGGSCWARNTFLHCPEDWRGG